ncbi:MAG TPA: beta-N-acetylhexosaminidase [Holosporales bacterium]|nr:beta-N-acetylhexosaminidase [Holosporales bacterium]
MMTINLPAIVGVKSTELTEKEIELFAHHAPAGFILFKRNCDTPDQVKKLIKAFHKISGEDCPILIDQEGGRVSRLKEPNFKEFREPSAFKTPEEAYANAVEMALQLKNLGITINCTPLADLVFQSTHQVIGDRSFGSDPQYIGEMAAAVIKGHFDSGITPVLKHLPGHGRAIVDSHEELPVVNDSKSTLINTDFRAFQETLSHLSQAQQQKLWGMTAHIVYDQIDNKNCATQSPEIIHNIIRKHIGFSGTLISDCLTMKALSGSTVEKAQKCLHAGCDIVLHCSGDFDEIADLLTGLSLSSCK